MKSGETDCNTIESQLFQWEGWDELDTADLVFYDVTFTSPVGPFKVGDHADSVAMMMSESIIEVYEGDETIYRGRLVLTVEDEVLSYGKGS